MPVDANVLLPIASKMIATALVVVGASVAAERAGALFGAMIASLPTTMGVAYVFLALDHDAAFISNSLLASFVGTAANGLFCLTYVLLAQRQRTLISAGGALTMWIAANYAAQTLPWRIGPTIAAVLGIMVICVACVERYCHVAVPPMPRRWYDIPLRTAMAAVLVAAVVTLSFSVGPVVTGMLAAFPAVLLSLTLILQPRAGGKVTAAVIANVIIGLLGLCFASLTAHFTVVPLGVPAGLGIALAMAIAFNLAIVFVRLRVQMRRGAARG